MIVSIVSVILLFIVIKIYTYIERTKIRGGKTCKKIVGFDANALYLCM